MAKHKSIMWKLIKEVFEKNYDNGPFVHNDCSDLIVLVKIVICVKKLQKKIVNVVVMKALA